MKTDLLTVNQIHARALEASAHYKRSEADLIDILQQVEDHRVYLKLGHASLFSYVVKELKLSESIAYCLITIARKSREVPELKEQLQSGSITLTNARRVAAVITPQNQSEWISKASHLSNRQLEKEIAKERPQEATPERASYVISDRIKLELGLSEKDMLRLRQVQNLMSQAKKRSVTLEEVIQSLCDDHLRRHDPVEKAKRHTVRNNATTQASSLVTRREATHQRAPIPAAIRHQVNLRDQRRCTHLLPDGSRCSQARFIEIHHKLPVSQGGSNTAENLTTLCSSHHKLMHLTA